jgi:hypothetical protein
VQSLADFTCCIRDEAKIYGTGFAVADNTVITCAHVITSLCTGKYMTIPGTEIVVSFTGHDIDYRTVVQIYHPPDDVAILMGNNRLPDPIRPALLCSPDEVSKPAIFMTIGYRHLGRLEGVPATGQLVDRVLKVVGVPLPSQPLLFLKSQDIGPGMSGAPLYLPEVNRVVGLITSYWDAELGKTGLKDRDSAFAMPAEVIQQAWPPVVLRSPAADILDEARKALVNCDYPQAISLCEGITSRQPDHPQANLLLAVALMRGDGADQINNKSRVEQVEASLRRATQHPTTAVTAWAIWGIVRFDYYVMGYKLMEYPPYIGEIIHQLNKSGRTGLDTTLLASVRASDEAKNLLGLTDL